MIFIIPFPQNKRGSNKPSTKINRKSAVDFYHDEAQGTVSSTALPQTYATGRIAHFYKEKNFAKKILTDSWHFCLGSLQEITTPSFHHV